MNSDLIDKFSKTEVEIALKQMAPLKAPGPDGMPPIFFQHYWSSIGDDVVKAVLSCLNSNHISSGLNHTFIALIPKIISKSQSTFQSDKAISDNILVAFKTLHHMKTKAMFGCRKIFFGK